jgi:hypothetical protein
MAQREKPKYKGVEEIIAEELQKGYSLTGLVEAIQKRLVIVVRTDNPANRV